MKFSALKTNLSFLLVALLMILLATLAWLQYSWIGEISSEERERRRRSANIAAENLTREFDREITRVFLQLQIDPIIYEKKSWDDYSQRYERWRATTAYPKMVYKIFVADKGEGGAIRLSVFNEAARGFEASEWLPQISTLKSRIEQDLNGQGATGKEKSSRLPTIVAEEMTALVIPISTVNLLNLEQIQKAARDGTPSAKMLTRRVGYTIVLLDSDYLKNELLPSLVARYFNSSGDGSADRYDVIVASRGEPSRIFYQSGALQPNAPREADVERDFFILKFDEIENLLPAKTLRESESLPSESGDKQVRSVTFSSSVFIASSNKNNSINRTNSTAAAPSLLGSFDSRWRLVARHEDGSLDAAVGKTRRRNLLVGGGILLLLGASGVLLLVLQNRARVFAKRQSDFTASVTHELRTPLAVIRSMSENLADGIVTDAEKIRQYGALINDEERRLSAMVENILGFAGAQTMRNESIELRPQSVADIIKAALEDYRAEIERHNFHVETIIEPELPPVNADADALRRAVGNLIGNALKYSDAVRRIELAARAARGKNAPRVEIIVKDEGVGIDPRDLPDVFKLFYRGRAAIEGQIGGSGIGLSLVKQIVEAHGGIINAASTPNQGSTFTITLPAIAEASVAGEEHLLRNE